MRVGPGGQAPLKVAKTDGAGKVEIWVYDDGTKPKNAKASSVGPRWGLVQGDGRALVVDVLYASYLSGDEGYRPSDHCDHQNRRDNADDASSGELMRLAAAATYFPPSCFSSHLFW